MPQKVNLGLAELHRPTNFDEVCGQDVVTDFLRDQLNGKVGRSVIFHGPSGCGKSTVARIYAEGLLCGRGSTGPCRKPDCANCKLLKSGRHPNLRTLNFATMDDRQFAAEINRDLESEILSDGWLVIWIDQADRMTSSSFKILEDRIRRPSSEVTFVLCVDELAQIAPPVKTSLYPLEMKPPCLSIAEQYLQYLSAKASITCAEGALELLAEVERPSFAQLALNLERLASLQPVTSERVVDVFLQKSEAKRYLDSCFSREGFEEQWSALWNWSEAPKRKVEAIGALLSHLLDPLAIGRYGRPVILELQDRRAIAEYLRSSQFEEASRAKLLALVLEIWRPEVIETRASLLLRASRFEELLSAGVSYGAPETLVRAWAATRKRSADAATRIAPVRSEPKNVKTKLEAGFLRVEDAVKLWDAASFMVQNYGILLNSRIVIRHDDFVLKKEKEPAVLMTDLFRELRIRLDGKENPIHWLYVHRYSQKGGLVTDIVTHLPDHRKDVDLWIRDKFLARRVTGRHVAESTVSVSRFVRENPTPKQAWRRHLTLIRLLCGSLDKSDPEAVRLMGLLGNKRVNHSIGGKVTAQRRGVSRGIDVGAQSLANGDLSVLTAFSSSMLSAFHSGWELTEYQYRQKLKSQRIAFEEEVRRDYKGTLNLDTRLATLKLSWREAAPIRERDRPSFS